MNHLDTAFLARFGPLVEACTNAIRGLAKHNVHADVVKVDGLEWPDAVGLTVLGTRVELTASTDLRGLVDARGRTDGGAQMGFIERIDMGPRSSRGTFSEAIAGRPQ